jgi:hypothetical protein
VDTPEHSFGLPPNSLRSDAAELKEAQYPESGAMSLLLAALAVKYMDTQKPRAGIMLLGHLIMYLHPIPNRQPVDKTLETTSSPFRWNGSTES